MPGSKHYSGLTWRLRYDFRCPMGCSWRRLRISMTVLPQKSPAAGRANTGATACRHLPGWEGRAKAAANTQQKHPQKEISDTRNSPGFGNYQRQSEGRQASSIRGWNLQGCKIDYFLLMTWRRPNKTGFSNISAQTCYTVHFSVLSPFLVNLVFIPVAFVWNFCLDFVRNVLKRLIKPSNDTRQRRKHGQSIITTFYFSYSSPRVLWKGSTAHGAWETLSDHRWEERQKRKV